MQQQTHTLPFSTIELEHLEGGADSSQVAKNQKKGQLVPDKGGNIKSEQIEDVNSPLRVGVIILAILSGNFSFGYSMPYLSMSFSTLFQQITLNGSVQSEQGFFSAILSIGCLVGAVSTHFLLKHATRNQSLIVADFCGFLSIFQVIKNREAILAFRFFYGMCIGIQTIIMPIYVKELCPQQYYAKFSVMSGFMVGGGILFANFLGLGYLNPDLSSKESFYWQIIFAVPGILFLLRFIIVTLIYKMESPISLLERKKLDSVKLLIAKIYKFSYRDQVLEKCQQKVQYDSEHKEGLLSIFSKKNRYSLAIGCVLMFVYTWSGLFAVFSYSSQFFASMASSGEALSFFILILGIVQFTPAFISQFVYKKWGKRSILLTGLLLMILCQVLIIGLSYSQDINAVVIKFVVICLFSFLYALTLGPITWVFVAINQSLTPEINSSQATYFCFVTLFAWQLLVLYIFPFMLTALDISGSFIVFAILTVISTVYFYYTVRETKGLSPDEINKLYGK